MTSAQTTTFIVESVFQVTGKGDGEPCASRGNTSHETPNRELGMGDERKNGGARQPDAAPPTGKTGGYAPQAPELAGNPPTQIP
jgi:hypothetical protein